MTRLVKYVLIGLVTSIGAFTIWSMCHPWSRINCTTRYVDVNTGRMRSVRYFLFLQVSDTIINTDFATLRKAICGNFQEPEWHTESTLRGFLPKNSPQYAYLGTFLWQDTILIGLETAKFSGQEKRFIIESFLALLKTNPIAAQRFSVDCIKFANEHSSGEVVTNLPAWFLYTTTHSTSQQ